MEMVDKNEVNTLSDIIIAFLQQNIFIIIFFGVVGSIFISLLVARNNYVWKKLTNNYECLKPVRTKCDFTVILYYKLSNSADSENGKSLYNGAKIWVLENSVAIEPPFFFFLKQIKLPFDRLKIGEEAKINYIESKMLGRYFHLSIEGEDFSLIVPNEFCSAINKHLN